MPKQELVRIKGDTTRIGRVQRKFKHNGQAYITATLMLRDGTDYATVTMLAKHFEKARGVVLNQGVMSYDKI